MIGRWIIQHPVLGCLLFHMTFCRVAGNMWLGLLLYIERKLRSRWRCIYSLLENTDFHIPKSVFFAHTTRLGSYFVATGHAISIQDIPNRISSRLPDYPALIIVRAKYVSCLPVLKNAEGRNQEESHCCQKVFFLEGHFFSEMGNLW